MLHRRLTTFLLCGLLAISAQASPITWSQFQNSSALPGSAFTQDAAAGQSASQSSGTAEAGTPPEFVRLPDGRVVPFGPGVICADASPTAEEVGGSHSRRWLIAIPIITAVVACAFLCRGSNRTRPTPPPFPTPTPPVGPPPPCEAPPCRTPAPTPTPVCTSGPCATPPPTPVPEPGTLLLVGVGLAFVARKGYKRGRRDQE